MRHLLIVAGIAAGLAVFLSTADIARAGDTATSRNYTPVSQSSSSGSSSSTGRSAQASEGQFERRCVTMSCGTPWCYNARIK